MPALMKQALELELIIREKKSLKKAASNLDGLTPFKKRKSEGLKTRDPW